MKIAVTGGSGELGRTLVPYLIEEGHQVVSMDRALPAKQLGGAEYLVVDTRNFGEMVGGMHGCDALIHLAAHRTPLNHPDAVVYNDNTTGSYNALSAAATLGITRVCLASSVNALGGAYSQVPRYDYFPVDEQHPTYAEDAYSLSKWVLEQQADAFVRRHPAMQIASMRFHWLMESRDRALQETALIPTEAARHLWSYIVLREASRACLLALTASFAGHEVFVIAAPRTAMITPSLDLRNEFYPTTEIRGDLSGNIAFFSSAKAERILGWKHED